MWTSFFASVSYMDGVGFAMEKIYGRAGPRGWKWFGRNDVR